MSFTMDIRHWNDAKAFREHLYMFPDSDYSWARRIVLHHTVKPLPHKWEGNRTMRELAVYYEYTKHWTAGPHLFVVSGAPDRQTDGIWQLTPLNVPGIHAGGCNVDGIGLEVVGNYHYVPWSVGTSDLVYGALYALLDRTRMGPRDVIGHRECMTERDCPGKQIAMSAIRDILAAHYHYP